MIGLHHPGTFQGRFGRTDRMVDGAQRTQKTAENPAGQQGEDDNSGAPQKSFDQDVTGQQGRYTDQRIELEKKVAGCSSLNS